MVFLAKKLQNKFFLACLLLIFGTLFFGVGSAFSQEFTSDGYKVLDPVMNAGGYGSSASFQLFGSISEISIGTSTSASFKDSAGFLYFPFASTPTVSATAGDGQVALSWTSSIGYLGWTASGYDIGRSTTSGGPYTYTSLGDVTSSTITGLTNSTTYYFVVVVKDAFDNAIATSTQISSSPVAVEPPPSGGGGGGPIMLFQQPQPLQAVFSGRAYPYSTVTLLKDAQVAASVVANSEGVFQIQVRGVSPGDYIFSIYAKDNEGRVSRALVIPTVITDTKVTETSGIFMPPTIMVDKLKVRADEPISVFGQSASLADIVVFVDGSVFATHGVSDKGGNYRISFDTSLLDYGFHNVETQAILNKNFASELSRFFEFEVGSETVFIEPDYLACSPIDFNNDCRVNLIDFSILLYWFDRTDSPDEIDLDDNGVVDIHDFSILAYYWTG